ncbi:MAG: UbiD family decarboxylase [Halobacteriota archaeon]|nr:UbiD family decarboxylase [Halobacteriota archaeon]
MNLRDFLGQLEEEGELVKVGREVDPNIEMAAVMNELGEKPTIFENVKGYPDYRVVGGLCSSRELIAKGLGTSMEELLSKISDALKSPKKPNFVESAPCQEVIIERDDIDLEKIPILYHLEGDGGPYVTSGVAIIKDPETGRNACYHRLMRIGKDRFTARVIEKRQTHKTYGKTEGDLEIAICIGNSMPVLIAASLGPPIGVDELMIAEALRETKLVRCKTKDLEVPAECEIVLEGRITRVQSEEGPFVDLTNTRDIIRQQPIIEIDCITRRKDPIYQALLPGQREHKLLMGMPKEPTIFNEVNREVTCKNVLITEGGCSWLHAVVQIKKEGESDAMKAAEAAYRGHPSLKNCIVVDEDVDIYDPNAIEWAIATRVQPHRDIVIKENQPSSSLDPSAEKPPGQKAITSKILIDATTPKGKEDEYKTVEYQKIDLAEYI